MQAGCLATGIEATGNIVKSPVTRQPTEEEHRLPCNETDVQPVVCSLRYELGHPGWRQPLLGAPAVFVLPCQRLGLEHAARCILGARRDWAWAGDGHRNPPAMSHANQDLG